MTVNELINKFDNDRQWVDIICTPLNRFWGTKEKLLSEYDYSNVEVSDWRVTLTNVLEIDIKGEHMLEDFIKYVKEIYDIDLTQVPSNEPDTFDTFFGTIDLDGIYVKENYDKEGENNDNYKTYL